MLHRVVDVALECPTPVWGFGVGGCLSGLVRAGQALKSPAPGQEVARRVGHWLARPVTSDPTDHLISVQTLQALDGWLPGDQLDQACRRWTRAVLDAARPVAGRPRVHRPDLERWRNTIWVDCMHTDGPGLVRLGLIDDGVRYAREYAAALQRDDGLFHHGYDVSSGHGNGAAWGRGQGWALLGLVDTLTAAPDDDLQRRLNRLLDALAQHERDGQWGTLVDEPAAPVEHSVAAYVALGVHKAVAAGIIDTGYEAMADRAWKSTMDHCDDGALTVSAATPVGPASDYPHQRTGVFAWGQAPLLHGLLDRKVSA